MIALALSASTTHTLNPTAVIISVGIPFVICAAIAVIVWAYFCLQAHRLTRLPWPSTASSLRTRWTTSRSCGPSAGKADGEGRSG